MAKARFFQLIILVLLLSGCILTSPSNFVAAPTVDNGRLDDWYAVYFTDPDDPAAGSYRGGPDSALAGAIREARLSVDAAIFRLDLWSIRDALIAAHKAGVSVRVVTDSDNMDEDEVLELQEVGIEVLGDRRESFMHHKFMVIDKVEVWTGSMNFTVNGAYRNNNNLICIRSSRLAENYTTEFEEMFIQDMFGNNVVSNTPHPQFVLNGIKIETYFSPDDNTEARLLSYIKDAKESIDFLLYSFTSDRIADAMIAKVAEGVVVRGVLEEGQYYSNIGTEFDTLLAAGIDVRLDGNRKNMHHKVMLIDGNVLITGSYNFSRGAAEKNDENTLIIIDTHLTRLYMHEFEQVFAQAGTER